MEKKYYKHSLYKDKQYYNSTRNKEIQASAKEAILAGLAQDGGLFVFDHLEEISLSLSDMMKMNYAQMAEYVLSALLFDFEEQEITACVKHAYEGWFDTEEVTPLVHSGKDFILELFHGPTSAFKDVGLRMLPQLMANSLQEKQEKIMVLTATSGDTGKAALAGFQDVEQIGITVFYPDHGVSEIQRLQMVTQEGKNVAVAAIKGNFDDAQNGVKQLFNDRQLKEKLQKQGICLSSANSINIGRLIPQIVYYFYAYKKLVDEGAIAFRDEVDFCVPTGNFGNVLAGYYAKLMGLPVHRFIVASNENHVLYDFLTTGVYDRNRPFHKTISPSMDILISSNLERLLYYASGKDADLIAKLMEDLKQSGRYEIKQELLQKIQSMFSAGYASDEACQRAIKEKYEQDGYALDPHSACGYHVMKQCKEEKRVCVLLATASPYKFCKSVYEALFKEAVSDEFMIMDTLEEKTGIRAPKPLKDLRNKAVLFQDVMEKDEMKDYVESKTKELLG